MKPQPGFRLRCKSWDWTPRETSQTGDLSLLLSQAGRAHTHAACVPGRPALPKQGSEKGRSEAVDRSLRLGIRAQGTTANLHKLASTMGKQASEASLRQCPATPIVLASKCGSRGLLIKAFENWAFCDRAAAFARVGQLSQRPFHGIKASNLCVYVSDLRLGALSNVRALCGC